MNPLKFPFMPYSDERTNTFSHTDSVVASTLQSAQRSPRKNLLVVTTAITKGNPPSPEQFPRRYHIPLPMAGSAVGKAAKTGIIGSRQDLAATLSAQFDLPCKAFKSGKHMPDRRSPHFAFFTVPDAFGFLTDSTGAVYDNLSRKITYRRGRSNVRKT